MTAEDNFDSVWDRMSESTPPEPAAEEQEQAGELGDAGPPIRITVVVKADAVPVAPWPQGWRIGVAGPIEGHVTLLFENDVDESPIAQLASVTGVLGTLKAAKLDLVWWAVQTRGPLPGEERSEPGDLDQMLSDLLSGNEPEAEPEAEA